MTGVSGKILSISVATNVCFLCSFFTVCCAEGNGYAAVLLEGYTDDDAVLLFLDGQFSTTQNGTFIASEVGLFDVTTAPTETGSESPSVAPSSSLLPTVTIPAASPQPTLHETVITMVVALDNFPGKSSYICALEISTAVYRSSKIIYARIDETGVSIFTRGGGQTIGGFLPGFFTTEYANVTFTQAFSLNSTTEIDLVLEVTDDFGDGSKYTVISLSLEP